MLNSILVTLMLLAAPQMESFKKEMSPLQTDVDNVINPTVYRIMTNSKATYLDGYGVVVVLEVALEQPPNPFSSVKSGEQMKSAVARRRKEITEKVSELLKERIVKTDSVGPMESIAVVVHMLNVTRADVGDLPTQLVISIRKDSPAQVNVKEF